MSIDPQAARMQLILRGHRIGCLYHFTDIDNLPLILDAGGIRSKEWLERKGWLDRVKTGGSQLSKSLDVAHDNWDKVSLSWCLKHPMAWWKEAEQHLCYLIVNLGVALQDGIVFTDRNATDNNEQRGMSLEGLQLVDFAAVQDPFAYTNQERKKRKQAEVLVPHFVPLADIEQVLFRSRSSLEETTRLCVGKNHPPFAIDSKAFFPGRYSYIKDHLLTAAPVSRSTLRANVLTDERVFRRGVVSTITLVVTAAVQTGVRMRFAWKKANGTVVGERVLDVASTTDNGRAWVTLDARQLATGAYQVACYITDMQQVDDIRQFIAPFTIE